MPIIDINKISKEVKDKYKIVNNAFRLDKIKNAELDKYTGEPKDEINVEIGDTKQTEFYPQVKLMRWSNEVNFSVRLKDTEYEKAQISTLQDKIIWDKDNIKIEFSDYAENEGGHKMVWYLKSKPATNKIEFSIQTKGLDFFYQPPLTPEEIAKGAYRPPEVEGSYAVYHQTKGGMNDINGKDYKTGKAFHIYRPHIIDAEGKETWGNLHIENGIYSVEIPQDFLDKAVYPIKSNDTFGNGTYGTYATTLSANYANGYEFVAPANGTVTSFTFYVIAKTSAKNVKAYLIKTSDLSLVTNGVGNAVSCPTTAGWRTSSFATSPSIISGTTYTLMIILETTSLNIYYSSGGTYGLECTDTANNYASPLSTLSIDIAGANKTSIYATYTPSGGGATNPGWMGAGGWW